jgi:hypothetical protein
MSTYEWKDGFLQTKPSIDLPRDPLEAAANNPALKLAEKPNTKREYVQRFERAHVVKPSLVRMASFQALSGKDERYLPVSHVAKDWQVTPRRIRALLAAGRLAGRLQVNGYWEVRFPYFLSIGTRGPALMHQKRVAAKRTKNTELKAVQNVI